MHDYVSFEERMMGMQLRMAFLGSLLVLLLLCSGFSHPNDCLHCNRESELRRQCKDDATCSNMLLSFTFDDGECIDRLNLCMEWMVQGACIDAPSFMFQMCAKSCDMCLHENNNVAQNQTR
jgi:hypothetical protein